MSIVIALSWGGVILALFSLQILAESTRQTIKQAFRDCRNMTRTTDFFPPYKHTK